MTRKSKSGGEKVDFTKPINLELVKISEDDCLGKLYDLSKSECIGCSSSVVCSILFDRRSNKDRIDSLKEKNGPFLDENTLDGIDEKKVLDLFQPDRNINEVFKEFIELSKMPDQSTAVGWLKRFIIKTEGLTVKEGVVVWTK